MPPSAGQGETLVPQDVADLPLVALLVAGEKAQDPGSHLGKILRLNDDGSIPDDNPFITTAGYMPEIYSLGHRSRVERHHQGMPDVRVLVRGQR